ncbi:MAG: hypothetical protein IPK82_04380 [Polyangiaceae bacterium]|nr:hypothetical protein [Polyangiaceae bacterium]
MASEASQRRPKLTIGPADEVAGHVAVVAAPVAIPIDSVADASLARARDHASKTPSHCDVCDAPIEGEAGGRGLFLSARGEEIRFEEPALCSECATAIGLRANLNAEIEEEEG